jgi:hypothetical protein
VIMADVSSYDSPQVRFPKHDYVIETFPAQAPDYPVYVRSLPGTVPCDGDLLDVEAPYGQKTQLTGKGFIAS